MPTGFSFKSFQPIQISPVLLAYLAWTAIAAAQVSTLPDVSLLEAGLMFLLAWAVLISPFGN